MLTTLAPSPMTTYLTVYMYEVYKLQWVYGIGPGIGAILGMLGLCMLVRNRFVSCFLDI